MAKPKPTNDALVRQLRAWNQIRLESNATRAAVAVVRLFPASQRTMKRAVAVRNAIVQAVANAANEVRG